MKLKSILLATVFIIISILGLGGCRVCNLHNWTYKYKVDFTKEEFSLDEPFTMTVSIGFNSNDYVGWYFTLVDSRQHAEENFIFLYTIEDSDEKYSYTTRNGKIEFSFTTEMSFTKEVLVNKDGSIAFGLTIGSDWSLAASFGYTKDFEKNTVKFTKIREIQ